VNGPDRPQASAVSDLCDAAAAALGEGGALARAIPGFRPREGQQALAASIAAAVAERGTLVAEAGTGTGKTFAYLVPLLLAGGKALVSTGTRHLQDQLHGRDLPAVRAALGRDLRTALLKGRGNYVCHHHLGRHRLDGRFADPGMPAKLRRIDLFAQTSVTGDRAECTGLAEDDPAWAHATSTRENCLGQECPEIKRCFVFRARREALTADVVVVNHHLFCADLALREDSIAELLPTADAVVFDEAHQLPDAATEFFGEAVSTRQLLELARDLVRAGLTEARDGADWRALADRLERAGRELRLAFEAGGEGGVAPRFGARRGAAQAPASRRFSAAQLRALPGLDDALDDLLADLVSVSAIVAGNAGRGPELDRCGLRATELGERLQRWAVALSEDGLTVAPAEQDAGEPAWDDLPVRRDDPPSRAVRSAPPDRGEPVGAGAFARAAGLPGPEPAGAGPVNPAADDPAVVWAETNAQHASLRRTPLSVAAAFGRHRAGPPRAWIFVSATLSVGRDFSHFVDALGLHDARCERWESPFDFARQAALWVPRGIGEASAPGFAGRVAQAVWPLVAANRGRAFFLCTTLRAMREIAETLRALDAEHGTGLQMLVQGDASRPELLERFRAAVAPVLIGSAGFWEGVDVAGDGLSLVVIDKLPFAPPDDPVVKARGEALRRAGRDPFAHDSVPAAAMALKQGAGRLIRSETDRGVLVVGDERLATRGYGRRLVASLPPFTRVLRWEDALAFLPEPRVPD
jgi:ATP-dependent DNA helicase DinG